MMLAGRSASPERVVKKARLGFVLAGLLLLASLGASAQYVPPYVNLTGPLSSSNGMPAQNYVLNFQPNQLFYVGGTTVVVSGSTCGTDTTGQIVGVRNPLTAPVVSITYGTGTLQPGNYWMAVSWYDSYGRQTLVSPVVMQQLTSVGSLNISPPGGGAPANAIGMNVYIGTAATSLVYQGQTASTTATYVQSTNLVTGAASPTQNTTVCQVVANDAGWPTGTGYNFSITTPTGNTLPGYPVLTQFLGPGSTYNFANGMPLYNGRIIYPTPLVLQPYNHNPQSISGPLSMGQPSGVEYPIYNVLQLGVGTAVPAWGVDVEGSGLLGAINANTGYLVNGAAPPVNTCLGSTDGLYFDTALTCITSLPTMYYQTVTLTTTASGALTQRPYIAMGPGTGLTAVDQPGVGSNVARTVFEVNTQATVSSDPYVTMNAASGASGHCASWDANGGIGDAGAACVPAFTGASGYQTLPSGLILEWGDATGLANNSATSVSLPLTFPHACFNATAGENENNTAARPGNPRTISAACSTTSITLWSSGSGSEGYWFAIGW